MWGNCKGSGGHNSITIEVGGDDAVANDELIVNHLDQ